MLKEEQMDWCMNRSLENWNLHRVKMESRGKEITMSAMYTLNCGFNLEHIFHVICLPVFFYRYMPGWAASLIHAALLSRSLHYPKVAQIYVFGVLPLLLVLEGALSHHSFSTQELAGVTVNCLSSVCSAAAGFIRDQLFHLWPTFFFSFFFSFFFF